MPFVEQVQIRGVSANDYTDITCSHPIWDGVIEFVTDKKLDDCLLVLVGSNISNFSWNDCIGDDNFAILTSYDVDFVKETNDKFLYKALFITQHPNDDIICDSIYCKVFMIRIFAPIYETNEFVIPYNKLFQMKNRVYNQVEPTAEHCSSPNH